MKKLICFLYFILLSAIANAQNAVISGKFSNAPSSAKVYLFEYFGSNFYVKDSTIAKGGVFKFSPAKPLPRGFYQVGENQQNSFIVIVANEQIQIEADWKNLRGSVNVSNSQENKFFRELLAFNTQVGMLEAESREIMAIKDQQPEQFNKLSAAFQRKYDSLMTANNNMKVAVMQTQPNLFFVKVLKMFVMDDKQDKESFFTENELKDDEYTRGDMMVNKIAFYLQKFAGNDEKLWAAEGNDLAARCLEKSKVRELVYISLIQVMAQSGMQIPQSTVKKMKSEFGNSPRVKDLIAQLPKPEPVEGDEAPEIILSDANGKKLPLSSLRGKYVLIDFWASWCGPCRMENPNVVRVYNTYKDKGFTIYSVSLDNSKDNWLAAIQKDGLTWPSHVSDLKGWGSEGAALYSVRGIPATFLIDKNGVIIGKNLRGYALEKKLSELIP